MTIDAQRLLAAHGSIALLSPMRLEHLKSRALQQLDYSGPGSRGKSIYVGATEVLELVAAARALADAQVALDAQAAEIALLREALKKCAAVCAGETFHKQGLIDALEAARAALAQEGS